MFKLNTFKSASVKNVCKSLCIYQQTNTSDSCSLPVCCLHKSLQPSEGSKCHYTRHRPCLPLWNHTQTQGCYKISLHTSTHMKRVGCNSVFCQFTLETLDCQSWLILCHRPLSNFKRIFAGLCFVLQMHHVPTWDTAEIPSDRCNHINCRAIFLSSLTAFMEWNSLQLSNYVKRSLAQPVSFDV